MNGYFAKLMALGTAALLFAGSASAGGGMGTATNTYGGPVYAGALALEITAALVKAGGGAEHFTIQEALVSMLGEKTVNAEVAKLTKQFMVRRTSATG